MEELPHSAGGFFSYILKNSKINAEIGAYYVLN